MPLNAINLEEAIALAPVENPDAGIPIPINEDGEELPKALTTEDVPLNVNLTVMDEDEIQIESYGVDYLLTKDGYAMPKKKPSAPFFPVIGKCQSCRIEIKDDGRTNFYAYGKPNGSMSRQRYLCKNCNKNAKKCNCCNYSFFAEDLKFGQCKTCVDTAHTRVIKPYSTRAEKQIAKMGKCLDRTYFGVEMEYESKDYGLDSLIVSELSKEFAVLKRDSSIKQGFEVVTAPATLDIHRNQIWDNFLKGLPGSVYVDETCGMHVHVSRVRMTNLQIGKILTFMHNPENRNYIGIIAGRPSSYHNDFTKPKKVTDGRDGGRRQADMDRHTAVNCNNTQTLEFRIFRATKDKHIILKNIEFCYALVKFQQAGNVGLRESKDFAAFYKFVFEFRKDYPELWKFLTSRSEFATLRKK